MPADRTRCTASVDEAIGLANQILPGVAAAKGEHDPRCQAIIEVGQYIAPHPEPIWDFICKWGSNEDEDLRAAISTCLLEHLIEEHFELIFPRVEEMVKADSTFAKTFAMCRGFIEFTSPLLAARFEALYNKTER